MIKQLPLVPLLEQFIKETKNGKRRKLNGERISVRTVENYTFVLKHVQAYEAYMQTCLRITVNIRNNMRLILREKQYWKDFYHQFSDYLLYQKGFYDNFVGSVFKVLKCFFRYLKNDRCLLIPECYERFYVRKEVIRVIALLPEQYCFLIMDKVFESGLSPALKRCKDIFVFGCAAALRYCDLRNLQVKNVEKRCGNYFLLLNSTKTDAAIQVKLPAFAIHIYEKYARRKKPEAKLFTTVAPTNFNKQLKLIGRKAGWTEVIGKQRTRNGLRQEVIPPTKKRFQFCELLSAHLMRKTGITVLLMLGMPECLVRKISGHASYSKEFFRYVNFAQSYITDELDKAHQKLMTLYLQ